MDYVIYIFLATLMSYFAYFFYNTKNGVIRKGLIAFFIGFALSIVLRPALTWTGFDDYIIAIHSPIPALVGVIGLLVAIITAKKK